MTRHTKGLFFSLEAPRICGVECFQSPNLAGTYHMSAVKSNVLWCCANCRRKV